MIYYIHIYFYYFYHFIILLNIYRSPSRVCDVYVCSIFKAAGLFGDLADQINCVEFENSGGTYI